MTATFEAERLRREAMGLDQELRERFGETPSRPTIGPPIKRPPGNPALATSYGTEVRERLLNEVYIYGLVDPMDQAIRYVGKTATSLEARLSGHLNNPTSRGMRNWIATLRGRGVAPDIIVLDICPRSLWWQTERRWIRLLRRHGNLLNVEDGGPHFMNKAPDKEQGKRRKGKRRRGRYGRNPSPARMVPEPSIAPFNRTKADRERQAIADASGPVRNLSREEIAIIYGQCGNAR